MMTYYVHLEAGDDGEYLAVCDDPLATGRGLSPENALDRLRAELRFQLEMCPCHSVEPGGIELEIAS